METQLLDGVMVIAFVDGSDSEAPFAASMVYRFDLEGMHLDEFIEKFADLPGVVHMDKTKANTQG